MCRINNRHDDAYRRPPLYDQIVREAQAEGRLGDEPWDDEVHAIFEAYRAEGKLDGNVPDWIGDDLDDEDLDNLWEHLSGGDPAEDSTMPGWWDDKPHQIAYRLLLRLTRAVGKLRELQEEE